MKARTRADHKHHDLTDPAVGEDVTKFLMYIGRGREGADKTPKPRDALRRAGLGASCYRRK